MKLCLFISQLKPLNYIKSQKTLKSQSIYASDDGFFRTLEQDEKNITLCHDKVLEFIKINFIQYEYFILANSLSFVVLDNSGNRVMGDYSYAVAATDRATSELVLEIKNPPVLYQVGNKTMLSYKDVQHLYLKFYHPSNLVTINPITIPVNRLFIEQQFSSLQP